MMLFDLLRTRKIRRMKDNGDISGLVNALGDNRLKWEARNALIELRPVSSLIEALRHSDDSIVAVAADALQQIGDPSAVFPVLNATTRDYFKAPEAFETLAKKLERDELVPKLIQELDKSDPVFSNKAHIIIKFLGDSCDRRAVRPIKDAYMKMKATKKTIGIVDDVGEGACVRALRCLGARSVIDVEVTETQCDFCSKEIAKRSAAFAAIPCEAQPGNPLTFDSIICKECFEKHRDIYIEAKACNLEAIRYLSAEGRLV